MTTHSFTPVEFLCPMTKTVMNDPMMSRYGFNFERSAILGWLARGNGRCPVSGNPLRPSNLVSNKSLQARIHKWASESGHPLPSLDASAANPQGGEKIKPVDDELEALVGKCMFIGLNKSPPKEMVCPLAMTVMEDPMMTREGTSFEREAILSWLETYTFCPVSGKPLEPCNLVKNCNLQKKISHWRQGDYDTEEDTYFMTTKPVHSKKQKTFASLAA
jgi:hypothetical protein